MWIKMNIKNDMEQFEINMNENEWKWMLSLFFEWSWIIVQKNS